MGCYIVPAAAFLCHKVLQKNKNYQTPEHNKLSLLLLGGTVFGVVDHAWNRELLFGKEGLLLDLALGVVITTIIFTVWVVMWVFESHEVSKAKS